MKIIPKEIKLKDKTLVLSYEKYEIDDMDRGYFILDFNRKFEDADLNKIPALPIKVQSLQDEYMIKKFNYILGEFKDI